MIIGIDPGNNGAIALLDNNGIFVDVVDIPTCERIVGGKVKTFIDDSELFKVLHTFRKPNEKNVVALENVNAMAKGGTKQGAVSMFNFGMGFGMIKMALTVLEFEVSLIAPISWKRQHGLVGSDKSASIPLARAFITHCGMNADSYIKLKKHDGRADAVLIATMADWN